MKTIKLHYKVKNYIYPFRVIVVIYDTQRVNAKQVDEQFSKTYSTLTLSPEETKLFNTFTTYQKLRFCIEHKKVLETRKDFVGETLQERISYFKNKLLLHQPKKITEYRKYLMETGLHQKQIFFSKHFQLILDKVQSNRIDILQIIDCIHIIQMYVQQQSLINVIQGYTSRIIKNILNLIQNNNLQIKRRGYKIISQLCKYYQNSYIYLFKDDRESSKQLDHIFNQIDTQNLFSIRILLKFIVHLMYCATKTSNFMLVIVECIETQFLHKLQSLRSKLKDKSFKIYETYDEYTNVNELESNTLALRIQKISVEKDSQFIQLKQQVKGLIDVVDKKFIELEKGKHKPQVEVNHQREHLKKKYEKKQIYEVPAIFQEQIQIKQHIRQAINPHNKRARKRSTIDNDFMRKAKYLDKMPPTTKQMTIQLIQGYQYRLLDLQNDHDKYRSQVQKTLDDRDQQIERLNRMNRELLEKIKRLEQDMRKSRKKSCDLGKIDLFAKNQGFEFESARKSIRLIAEIENEEEQKHQQPVNRVRSITKILQSTKHITNNLPVLPPPPPPPPPLPSLIGNLSSLPATISQGTSMMPPPPPMNMPPPPPPFLMNKPKINPNRRPKIQIKTPMKLISWNILQLPQIKGTVWQDMQDPHINILDVQQSFFQGIISPTSKTIRRLPARQNKASYLNSDRARMIELILLKLKLDIPKITKVMYELDQDILQPDTIMSLLSILPQQAQIPLYKNKQLQYSKLSISDQFYFKICNITGYEPKLRSLKFKNYFEQSVSIYQQKINYFKTFFLNLKEDVIFQTILKYSLAIGNIMNSNSIARQGAYGFKLDSLQKLNHITSSDNKQTLLEYTLRLIKKQQPQLLKHSLFYSYGNNQGVSVSSKAIASDFLDYTKNLSYVKRALTQINEQQGDVSSQYFFKFYREAKEKLDRIENQLKDAESIFNDCQKYYLDTSESQKMMSSVIELRIKARKELMNQ